MKLSATFFVVATASGLVSAAPSPERRQLNDVTCLENIKYLGGYDLFCENLASDCIYKKSNGSAALWSHQSCVAAATCAGASNIYIAANCTNPQIADSGPQVPSLDYNLYAKIVGSCAWQPNGCPITEQNYIDFLYGSLTAINSSNWPYTLDQPKQLFGNIKDWTKTNNTVPYVNFNDWLHYSF